MSSIKKNLAYNMFYQILTIIIPLITAPYVSRVLGADGIGVYSYTYSIASYFMLFAMLGISNHGNRSIASTPKNKKELGKCFVNNYVIQLCVGGIVTLVYILYVVMFSGTNKTYKWIQILVVLSAVLDINWFFWGIEKFKFTVIRNTVCKVLSVITIFLFVKNANDLNVYIFIMSLTVLISQLLLWKFIVNEIDFCLPTWNEMKINIKPIFVLFLPILAYSLYRIMDKIMIGQFSNMENVGYYENAEKILNIPIGIITALGNVMLPRISNLLATGKRNEQYKYMHISFNFVSIVEGALCFGIASVAQLFSVVYYGNDFLITGKILQIIIFTALISGWANVIRTQYLIPMRKDNIYVISMLVAAAVNCVLNLIFIPNYGAMGAIVGTVSAEMIVLIIQAISVRSAFEWKIVVRENLPYILAGGLMYVFVQTENNLLTFVPTVKLLVEILTGGMLYIVIIAVISRLKKDVIYQYAMNVTKKIKN